jgi:zinc/manganese transport system substrate-binding protein
MLLILRRAAAMVTALAMSGSGAVRAADDDPPVIIATTSIWADIVDQIDCGDHFAVRSLIPIGGDAHSYEPSMRDREVLTGAALVVANGGGLEEQLADTLDAVAGDGTPLVTVFDHVTTAPLDDHADEEEHADEDEHEHEGDDPHVWFDPTLIVEAAPSIAEALVDAGADEATTSQCVEDFTAAMDELDGEITDILSAVPADRRMLVTNHDALGYFARRYGFEIVGSVLPGSSTLAESSPAELEQLAETIESAGVPAIFAEALESTDEATSLGERLGVEVVTLYTDSLGEPGSGAETYPDMMRFDAHAIATALGED